MSLMSIMRESPDIAKRIEEGTKEVRETKKNLLNNAAEFTEIYHNEIEEGTKKHQLLLENGAERGLKEEDVLKEHGKFIPSKETPIMNFIYFLMRDGDHPNWMGIHKELNKSHGHNDEQLNGAMSDYELDQILGWLVHEDEKYQSVKEPQEMDRFIYGNMSHDIFVKMKKLKALATSPNKNEALLAYRLCWKLCKKYGLEYDKIPCAVEPIEDRCKNSEAAWG